MTTLLLSDLRNRWIGRPAAVLGGGPSLPGNLARVPDDALLIAVNYHAFYHCTPDYMVYLDDPLPEPEMMKVIRYKNVIKVCPESEYGGDVRMDVPYWRGNVSSTTATWLACWLGCDPVLLCGMDLYRGKQKHCHPPHKEAPPAWSYPLDDHLRPWVEEAWAKLPHPQRVRVMSGPLTRVFPLYQEAAYAA